MTLLLVLAGCSGTTGTPKESQPTSTNNKPVAEAGSPVTVAADQSVDLNGGSSRDPDGDPLSYHWSFEHVPDGSLVPNRESPFTSNHSDGPTTSFMPDAIGTYVVRLEVQDNHGSRSDPDFVVITIEDPSTLPVANAGSDITTMVGQSVTMSGAGSYDPQGRPFTYSWSIIDKPASSTTAALTGPDTVAPSFTPDVKGVYVVNL